jgi:hypothetical protein
MRLARLVPVPVKGLIKDALRDSAIRRALKPMKVRGAMTPEEVVAFHKAWDNTGFSADPAFLGKLLELLTAGPVLECGTGGTTLLENLVGLRLGFKTYCLEQDRQWAQRVIEWGIEAVKIIDAPLKNLGGYHWYDVRSPLPMHFALVVCDGPYIDVSLGEPSYSAWRYGVLRWFKETGRTFDALLFDDVNDKRGPALLERWQREFSIKVQRFPSEYREYAIVTVRVP